jgi:uncharacterized protein YdaL
MTTIKYLGLFVAFTCGPVAGCGEDTNTGGQTPYTGSLGQGAPPANSHAHDRGFASSMIWNIGPGDPHLKAHGSVPAGPPRSASGPGDASTVTTLVLYDTTGEWAVLGELYAMGAVNLASHFGGWTAKAATAYACGELATYQAMIYIGSTFDEPLPTCLLDDVLAGSPPVLWANYNVWQLANHSPTFAATYGWTPGTLDFSSVAEVDYKGRALARFAANGGGILATTITDTTKATVLALAKRADGTTLPWATRSGNLTYIGDIPFTYMTEEDRYLAFADLLFDALAPATPERHRAVLRLEDIRPSDDAAQLQAVAEYLYAQGIPYGFGVIAEYRDPAGYYNDGTPVSTQLDKHPDLVATIRYMLGHGGVIVTHGFTHQWDPNVNPYTRVTGDDNEFYRVTENADHTLSYVGPLPGDSLSWAGKRMDKAKAIFLRANLAAPTIFEVPHYAGSVSTYRAAAARFAFRWERALYFPGLLRGTAPDYAWIFGQLFPYPVRDVYGTRVLPENLGNIEPEPFHIFPARLPPQIINAAEKNLVVRDGVAGFYFHPFLDIQYLKDTVDGLRALGYTFTSPSAL